MGEGITKFDRRLEDLIVEEMIHFTDGTIQVNGVTWNGDKVWMTLICRQPYTVRQHLEVD